MSSTALPPGNCVVHGYHGRTACPQCSTSALPFTPLIQSPPVSAAVSPAEPAEREWGVASWHPKEGTRVSMIGWTTEEDARKHYAWLCGEWRDGLRAAAEANEASGFEGGNREWYVWNNSFDGKKDMRFALVSRPRPSKAKIEEAEDDFPA